VQFFDPTVDIKMTAENVAIPTAAPGHTIMPIAQVQLTGSGLQVTDLRPVGGTFNTPMTAEYIVRSGGIIGVDCTHTDFQTAYNAAIADPRLAVSNIRIYVVNGTWNLAAALTVPNNLTIEGRTDVSNGTGTQPSIVFPAGSAGFTIQNGSVLKNLLIQSGAGPTVTVTGINNEIDGCLISSGTFGPSGTSLHVINNVNLTVRDCQFVTGVSFASSTYGFATFHDCLFDRNGNLGDKGYLFYNCYFGNVGTIVGGGDFYNCRLSQGGGAISWQAGPSRIRVFSSDLTATGGQLQLSNAVGTDQFEFNDCVIGSAQVAYIQPQGIAFNNCNFTALLTVGGVGAALFINGCNLNGGLTYLAGTNLATYAKNSNLYAVSYAVNGAYLEFDNCQFYTASFSNTGGPSTIVANGCSFSQNVTVTDQFTFTMNNGQMAQYITFGGSVGSATFNAVGASLNTIVVNSSTTLNLDGCVMPGAININAISPLTATSSHIGAIIVAVGASPAGSLAIDKCTLGLWSMAAVTTTATFVGSNIGSMSLSSTVSGGITIEGCTVGSFNNSVDSLGTISIFNTTIGSVTTGCANLVLRGSTVTGDIILSKIVGNATQAWTFTATDISVNNITIYCLDGSQGNTSMRNVASQGAVQVETNGTVTIGFSLINVSASTGYFSISRATLGTCDLNGFEMDGCAFSAAMTVNTDGWTPGGGAGGFGSGFPITNTRVYGNINLTGQGFLLHNLSLTRSQQSGYAIQCTPGSVDPNYVVKNLTIRNSQITFNGSSTSDAVVVFGPSATPHSMTLFLSNNSIETEYTPRIFRSFSTNGGSFPTAIVVNNYIDVLPGAGAGIPMFTGPAGNYMNFDLNTLRAPAGQVINAPGVTMSGTTNIGGTTSSYFTY